MIPEESIPELRPLGFDSLAQEPFGEYVSRVRAHLPDWPASVLEQWIYRHYAHMIRDYGWLLTKVTCRFKMTELATDEIIDRVNTHKMELAVDPLGYQILANAPDQQSWLQREMLTQRTWPVPVIVLDNRSRLVGPKGEEYGTPLHLLEGHLRLGYLRALYRSDQPLVPLHRLWLGEISGIS